MLCLLSVLATTLLICDPLLARPTTPQQTQWIAVVAPKLRESIDPLIGRRQTEGFHVAIVDSAEAAAGNGGPSEWGATLRAKVRHTWQSWSGPSMVLLVGAPIAKLVDDPAGLAVPALQGTTARMVGQPSDNGYGCRDGQLLPCVAVGRFPARTPAEAEAMVRKTLAWETRAAPGLWKRRFVLLAGAPSYNPIVDRMIETLAVARLAELDPVWTGNVIYHNPNSHYTLPTERLLERAQVYLNEGQLLTVFLGHSGADGFWFDQWRGPYFSGEHWATLEFARPNGVFATFGCWAAQYDGRGGEGYGLHAIRNPSGPVAVIGAHGECFAAMATLFSRGLLKNLPGPHDTPRLGEVWLAMKAELASAPLNPLLFKALNAVDGDPTIPEAEQRLEHQEMFTLLGDPAVRLPGFPHTIEVECPQEISPGEVIEIAATLPSQARDAVGSIELRRPLNGHSRDVQPVPEELGGRERAALVASNHDRANNFTLCEAPLTIHGSQASARLRLPEQLPWQQLTVRVYARSARSEAIGVCIVCVRSSKSGGRAAAP